MYSLEDLKNKKLVIPVWVFSLVATLGAINVLFGSLKIDYIYDLLLFLGADSLAEENQVYDNTWGLSLKWPKWIRRTLRGLAWFLVFLFLSGSLILSRLK